MPQTADRAQNLSPPVYRAQYTRSLSMSSRRQHRTTVLKLKDDKRQRVHTKHQEPPQQSSRLRRQHNSPRTRDRRIRAFFGEMEGCVVARHRPNNGDEGHEDGNPVWPFGFVLCWGDARVSGVEGGIEGWRVGKEGRGEGKGRLWTYRNRSPDFTTRIKPRIPT